MLAATTLIDAVWSVVIASLCVLLRKAAPGMSFDEVGVPDVESSIQIDVRFEVGRVGSLSGAAFCLVGIPDVGPFIFIGVTSKNVH